MNLITDNWIPVVSPNASRQWVSLRQALSIPGHWRISHPMAYLDIPVFMQAAALTQYLADRQGGLPKEHWLAVMRGEEGTDIDWLFDGTEDLEGFSLFGHAAYLQLPAALMTGATSEAIIGLFQPVRARIGTSKALRLPTQSMRNVCSACATIGIYVIQHFSADMSQYWGASPVRGALVSLLEPLGTLGRVIYANLLHRKRENFLQHTPLTWVPDSDKHNGMDKNGCPPFQKYLNPEGQLSGITHLHFPLIRGLRLNPPLLERGACDCCGRGEQELIGSFVIKDEPFIFKGLPVPIRKTLKTKSKVLQRTLDLVKGRHAWLSYRQVKSAGDEDAPYMPRNHRQSLDDAKAMRPAWVTLGEMFSERASKPSHLQQFMGIDEDEELIGTTRILLYQVSFKGTKNSTPKIIINEAYGAASLSAYTPEQTEMIGPLISNIAGVVERHIDAWIKAAMILQYDVESKRNDTSREELRCKEPRKKRKGVIREEAARNSIIRACARRLWEHALIHIDRLLNQPDLLDSLDHELFQKEAGKDIFRQGIKLWNEFQTLAFDPAPGLRELFLESEARRIHHNELFGKPKKNKRTKQEQTP
ncbi:MAG: type I-E CRISPR-associated protein Cse1/CasA [Gammaproteobacteria bacterium]|nr:type I-E CRISPR-associated protein Cse1/CasA [Gammaproteobacteria bacterium]